MNYTPNVDGALWFCDKVWPAIRAGGPTRSCSIVGSDPAPAIRRLHSAEHGIEVTGTVEDVRPYLWRSAVAIAPLLTARGIQTKVLEAVGAGLPVVVTSQVLEGLPTAIRSACRLGISAELFAEETLGLLSAGAGGTSSDRRHRGSDRARLGNPARPSPSMCSRMRGDVTPSPCEAARYR